MASLSIHLVSIPLLVPFVTRFGTEKQRTALILVYKAEGLEAYSECVTSEQTGYSHEDNASALRVIKGLLAPELREGPTPRQFVENVSHIRGNMMAKAAVEMLLWDARCKAEGKRVADVLGRSRGYANVGVSLGFDKPEKIVRQTGEALKLGYKRVKLKIIRGKEFETVKRVRKAFPDAALSVDANGGYTLEDAKALERLDEFGLEYIEQPLGGDLASHAELAEKLRTPICLDESIPTASRAREAVKSGAAKIINVKPGRMGGLSSALDAISVVDKAGGKCWIGGMLETGVGRAFNVALSSLEAVEMPGDTSPNSRYFRRDIVKNPFKMRHGTISPGNGPGIGVELDRVFLEKSTTETWKIF